MITDEQLKEWRESLNGVTPGPLTVVEGEYSSLRDIERLPKALGDDDPGSYFCEGLHPPDARFAVKARTAMPLLIEEVTRLRDALNRT